MKSHSLLIQTPMRKVNVHFMALLLLATAGCAGSGDGGNGATPIGGVVNAVNYVLPAGASDTVTSNLTINASNSIEIDGNLTMMPGVSVKLVCPNNLVIKGNITDSPASALAIRNATALPRDLPDNNIAIDGGDVTVAKGAKVKGKVNIGCTKQHPLFGDPPPTHVTIDGSVQGVDGVMGNPGTKGGNIEIGTVAALVGLPGATAPDIVVIFGSVTGGHGGGGALAIPKFAGNDVSGTGGDAGAGGDINIEVTAKTGTITCNTSVIGGQGGRGGDCDIIAKGGNAVGIKGGDAIGKAGAGGDGGNVTISVAPNRSAPTRGGTAGDRGGGGLAPGNGGPSGAGGNAIMTFSRRGKPGKGFTIGLDGDLGLSTVGAGNGGNSVDTRTRGAAGGNITLTGTVDPKSPAVLVYGSTGGNGFSGCNKNANTNGTNGGAAGTMASNGFAYRLFNPVTFRGGNGGDGVPHGTHGGAGFDTTLGVAIGKAGDDGKTCPFDFPGALAPNETWCDSKNDTIYVTGTGSNDVGVMTDGPSGMARPALVRPRGTTPYTLTGSIPVGVSPYAIVGDSNGKLFVANADATLSIVTLSQNKVTATLPIGHGNKGTIAYDADNGHVYVANSTDGTVTVVDGATDTVIKTLAIGPNPFGVQCNNTLNTVYVASGNAATGGGLVTVINGFTDTATKSIPLPSTGLGLDVNYLTGVVYVVNGVTVSVIDGNTNAMTAAVTITAGSQPKFVACSSPLGQVFVSDYTGNRVYVMNTNTNALVKTLPTGIHPSGLGLFPTTNIVYVPNAGESTMTIIDGATDTVTGTVNLNP